MEDKYFLYDPEGDGFQTFATAAERDEAAAKALPLYIVDGEWDETVFEVVAGEITHITEKTNVVRRPDDLNDDSEDASGEYWQPYTSEKFNVKMQPAPACEAAARELATLQAAYAQVSAGAEAMQGQLADLHSLCDRQADILSRVAVALRGPEPPQTKWSHHDLPERVAAVMRELADLRTRIADLQAQNIELHERRIADLRRRRPRVEGRAHSIRCAGYQGVDAPFNDAYCDCGAIYNQLADLRARLAARLASCEADADFGMVIRCADEAAWLRDLLREEAK